MLLESGKGSFPHACCVFRYTSTTTYTSTVTPTCYTTDLLVLGRACTIKTILGVVQVGGKKRRKRSEDVVETRPVVSVDGVEVDYDELIRPHKVWAMGTVDVQIYLQQAWSTFEFLIGG